MTRTVKKPEPACTRFISKINKSHSFITSAYTPFLQSSPLLNSSDITSVRFNLFPLKFRFTIHFYAQ